MLLLLRLRRARDWELLPVVVLSESVVRVRRRSQGHVTCHVTLIVAVRPGSRGPVAREGWSDPLRPPRSAPSPKAPPPPPSARRAAPARSPAPQVRTRGADGRGRERDGVGALRTTRVLLLSLTPAVAPWSRDFSVQRGGSWGREKEREAGEQRTLLSRDVTRSKY